MSNVSALNAWKPASLNVMSPAEKQLTLEQELDQARKQGYQEGLAQAQAEVRQRMSAMSAEMNALWEAMQAPFEGIEREVQAELVGTAIAVATAVIGRELKTDEAAIERTMAVALEALASNEGEVEVRVNPNDADFITALFEDKRMAADIRPDPGMIRGGARLSRGRSIVDASVEGKIRTAIKALANSDPGEGVDQSQAVPLDAELIETAATRLSGEDDE